MCQVIFLENITTKFSYNDQMPTPTQSLHALSFFVNLTECGGSELFQIIPISTFSTVYIVL